MAPGRSRQVRRAALIPAIGMVCLLALWAFVLQPAPLRQFVAELSDYSIRGSVYAPRLGRTVGGFDGSSPDVRLDGVLKHELVIAQKEGRRISRISRDGTVVWTRRVNRWVTGLELAEGALIYSEARFVGALDPDDGKELWRNDLGEFIAGIGLSDDGVLIARSGPANPLEAARFRRSARAGIEPPEEIPGTGGLANARHAVARGDDLLIADTFNHRIILLRTDNGQEVRQIESFFPNQVQMQPDGAVLVVEEHANRIVRHGPTTGDAAVILSCQHPLFQALSGSDHIRAREKETGRTPLFGSGARSVCDSRIDHASLYSPNGFHVADDSTIYVADTDNHRVAMFDRQTGTVRGVVSGLNNPVRVIALPDADVEEGS